MCENFSSAAFRTVEKSYYEDDGGGTTPLLRQSQALEVLLSVVLVGLAVCLLGLLLHKRERR